MGGKNKKFVENEFEKFMDYVYQLDDIKWTQKTQDCHIGILY